MQNNSEAYEVVVGLEVHAQLLIKSKLFCSDSAEFGAEPNTHISAVVLAHPGTLPKMNQKAIELAVKMGLACNSEIVKENYFARKNYFYPDLPKGYQLSQHTTPVCKGGHIIVKTKSGEKKIRLNRIHIEEDAGKSLHDQDLENTCIDFNRAGVGLIEIVTEPDINNAEEAYTFITELRKLVRYLEICDGNMEQGSLRCDANISVRKKGDDKLGTKVEVKNLNSIRNVKRAVEFESERMIEMLKENEAITQQTRSFDADNGTTFFIRDKEDAEDYRYFPDPDLTKFSLTDEFIESTRKKIPVLQAERIKKYMKEYQLSEYDAAALTDEREFADFFESVIHYNSNYKGAANWMLGPIKSWMNENNAVISHFPISPEKIAIVIRMIDEGKLNFSIASAKLFPVILQNPEKDLSHLAEEKKLFQESDVEVIKEMVEKVVKKFPEKISEYKNGKKGLMQMFVGEVMKLSKGKADPKIINEILSEKINS
jgi:aspartyl-tRNA(Asn)/glutamyl-tRNA(Gln) amidotransferase subunit B